MDEKEFHELIGRYLSSTATPGEVKTVEAFFDSYFSHEHEWPRDIIGDAEAAKSRILQKIYDQRRPVRKVRSFVAWRVAATVLLLAVVGVGAYHYYDLVQTERYAVIETTSGSEIQKTLLSDGSIVWLKPGSVLAHPRAFRSDGERRVTLTGEALFEVVRDSSRPFVIQCGELTTTVLGTSFNIKAERSKIEVVVLTGRVSLTSATDKQGVVVLPNEKAVYNKVVKQIAKIEEVETEEAVATVEGTEYNMRFEDTPMKEIIRRIEGKFHVTVTTDNAALASCIITADFTGQSLENTLDIITTVLDVEYEINDKEINLSGKGCD